MPPAEPPKQTCQFWTALALEHGFSRFADLSKPPDVALDMRDKAGKSMFVDRQVDMNQVLQGVARFRIYISPVITFVSSDEKLEIADMCV